MTRTNSANATPTPELAAFESPDSAWRTLRAFAWYRMAIVVILAGIFWGFTKFQIIGSVHPFLAALTLGVYLAAAAVIVIATQLRITSASVLLTAQILTDITAIVLLMHASGGSRSGIGMLLMVSLAAGTLVSQGRIAYFHAAVATLATLFEQLWQLLYMDAVAADFIPSGMLCIGYFVIAGLGNTLAKYVKGAEKIAEKRGVDLANLAQINALVIRDMQDGFVVVDEFNIIRQHNPQSTLLVGGLVAATGQALGQVSPQLAQSLSEWRGERKRIFPIVRDLITKREYQPRFVSIGEADISPTVVFIEDASRIRLQAQQMKLAALGRLTASIAHEIRNPLSSINHATELLKEDSERSQADARLLSIIHDNAHRLDRLVEEVLYLNRRDRAHPEPIDLPAFLTQFLNDFCAIEKQPRRKYGLKYLSAGNKEDISLNFPAVSAAAPALKALFDRAHLDQIMWNLVRNATRFSSNNDDAICLLITANDITLTIAVSDDGPGVSAPSLLHLFEPFFTTDAKGTGLGLYIARELAEVNNGTLEYVASREASEPVGHYFQLQVKRHVNK